MSDRTNFQLYVYDAPEDQRAAILELIAEADLSYDWDMAPPDDYEFRLGEGYTDDGAAGDLASELGAKLREAAPGATFLCWTDPAYEWLGELYAYAPDLGSFEAECDANGQAVYGGEAILDLIDKLPDDTRLAEVKAAIAARTGEAWQKRMTELRRKLEAAGELAR